MREVQLPYAKIISGNKQREALAENYCLQVARRWPETKRPEAFSGRKERSEGVSLIAYKPPPKIVCSSNGDERDR
jgi:hypothetical protein